MDLEHSHAYMHEHGIPHEHHHENPHAHIDEDEGCSGSLNCGKDCERCESDPKAEIIALMRFMVNHNAVHANELIQLAERLKELGDETAYENILCAVSDFEKGNLRLSAVLSAMIPAETGGK